MVLEMTDRHNVIFHLMIAGMAASLVSMIVDKHSLYDHLKVHCMHDLHHEDDDVPLAKDAIINDGTVDNKNT